MFTSAPISARTAGRALPARRRPSRRASTLAGCTTITHGSQITEAEAKLMAERGTFFEPQTGLLLQNYLENKPRFLGVGNFDEAGFKFMEDGIALNDAMFKMAIKQKG